MARQVALDLDDLTPTALKRLVKQLLVADDSEEKSIMESLRAAPRNKLADLCEEKHGKANCPMVEDDEEAPKKGKK
jgi:hypothetical protein